MSGRVEVKKSFMYELMVAIRNDRIEEVLANHVNEFGKKEVEAVITTLKSYVTVQNRFFKVSRDLSEMLQKTDIKKIALSEFKLPFPACYYLLEEPVPISEEQGVVIEGAGIIFTEFKKQSLSKIKEKTKQKILDNFGITEEYYNKLSSLLNIFFTVKDRSGARMVHRIVARPFSTDDLGEIDDLVGFLFRNREHDHHVAVYNVIRVVCGAVLYMNNYKENCYVTDKANYYTKKKKEKHIDRDREHIFMDVPIKLKRKLADYRRILREGGSKISHCFWVRGHWRQYKKKNDKRIWIVPYMKGVDFDILKEKSYNMER